MPCLLQAGHQVIKGFFPESVHFHDFFPELSDFKDISKIFDKSFQDKFLQGGLRQTVYIHSIPADEKGKRFNLLGLTVWIRAVKRFHLVGFDHSGFLSAHRTGIRDFQLSAASKILRNLRDDHICLINLDSVSDSQLQLFHNTDIVDTGPAHCSSLQLHRLKDCYGIDQPCS